MVVHAGLTDFLSTLDERYNAKLKRMEHQWQVNQGGLEPHLQVDHLSELLSGKVCCIIQDCHALLLDMCENVHILNNAIPTGLAFTMDLLLVVVIVWGSPTGHHPVYILISGECD